mmetsp:Transcript_47190/g.135962  ORF Transcript_47190/g.135962 Transcript_47190/m.135962 type:complete len:206 (+) Transcript_47190:97-714(+)
MAGTLLARALLAEIMDVLGLESAIAGSEPLHPSGLTRHRVQLVVTPVGPWIAQGYHSSVLIDSTEYSFSDRGITKVEGGPKSHSAFTEEESDSTFIDYGWHDVDIAALEVALKPHFAPGSYDLLQKNCNSFSDTILQLVTGRRLDKQYRQLEEIGRQAEWQLRLLHAYAPNPRASGFDACATAGMCRAAVAMSPAADMDVEPTCC